MKFDWRKWLGKFGRWVLKAAYMELIDLGTLAEAQKLICETQCASTWPETQPRPHHPLCLKMLAIIHKPELSA